MKRQTILTLLVVLLAVGMLVAVVDPVVAAEQGISVNVAVGMLAGFAGSPAATLIPVSIEYPAQDR